MKKLISSIIIVIIGFFAHPLITNVNNASGVCSTINTTIFNESIEFEQSLETPKEFQEIKPEITKQEELSLKLNEIKSINDKMEWFIAYKSLVCEYAEWIEPPKTVFDAFTEDEIRLICRAVETETYDQDFDSKVNVACVVFNRLEDGRFGDTITEVVTSPYQFAYGRKNITESTILAVMYAYECQDTTQGALYFHSNKKTETFCGASFIFQDGAGHCFYR